MPERVTPMYRYRGDVEPSADVARPVQARVTTSAAADGKSKSTSGTLDIFDCIDSYGGWWGISARDVDAALKSLGDVDTVYVRLNSPGGDALEGVAIANLLRGHKATVRVTVYGLAASAASVIATAGDTVSMAPGSMLMVHDASDFAWGNAAKLRQTVSALDAVSDSYADLYAMKAGGDRVAWREVMQAEKWYPAQDAVAAKLADAVGIDPQLPAGQPPVEEADDNADTDPDVVVVINPAARAVAQRCQPVLAMYEHAPAALAAPQAPAALADGSTTHEGIAAVAFTDEQLTTMRQQLGVASDADEATILAALGEALAESAADPPAATTTAPPAAAAVPEGKVLVSQNVLDELKSMAQAGAAARAKQLADERDEAIGKAFTEGKISADRRAAWTASWDKDPEGTKADLESLPARFPVGDAPGHAGDTATASTYTDEMAAQDAELFGLSKEAFTR